MTSYHEPLLAPEIERRMGFAANATDAGHIILGVVVVTVTAAVFGLVRMFRTGAP